MSNTKSKSVADELRFRLSVNLHYGAINLLNQSFGILVDLGVASKSELQRVHRFIAFYQNILVRGGNRFFPEPSKSTDNEQSKS